MQNVMVETRFMSLRWYGTARCTTIKASWKWTGLQQLNTMYLLTETSHVGQMEQTIHIWLLEEPMV